MENQSIEVIVRDSKKIIIQDRVFALSSKNDKGPFDVLPQHANFICLCKEFLVLHKVDGEKQEMKIAGALLKVSTNKVNVYLGIVPTSSSYSSSS